MFCGLCAFLRLFRFGLQRVMSNITEVPVLIVGGGAAACVLSMELARRGVEYRCIERTPGPGRESRAIAMHARTIELFDLVDKELSKRILERDLWCKGYVMHFLRDGERLDRLLSLLWRHRAVLDGGAAARRSLSAAADRPR